MTVKARGLVFMQTRNLLLSVSLITSVLATASPSFARGASGGGRSVGSHVSSSGGGSGGGHAERGFFHGGRGYGYGYGYGGGGYGNGYGYGGGGVWGQGAAWGNGGGGYANYAGSGGGSTSNYAASYAPEQLVKNYSWPDSHGTPNAPYAQAQATVPTQQTLQAPPTGKAAKAGVLDDLIKETSKY
jgi:hypothetical protein